jgi:hypothetical protein
MFAMSYGVICQNMAFNHFTWLNNQHGSFWLEFKSRCGDMARVSSLGHECGVLPQVRI